jgi:hypothetical protein
MKHRLLLVVAVQLLVFKTFAQFFPNEPIAIFSDNGTYKYWAADVFPGEKWTLPNFADSLWTDGYKSIGWGDADDSTYVNPCNTVYLRIHFNLTEVGKAYNLMADFDDGFVAYLNGVEIARVNLGDSGSVLSNNQLTTRSHEAVDYRNFFNPVKGFYIDAATIAASAVVGDNVLAVEVHNDSIHGSDLSFNASLLWLDKVSGINIYSNEQRYYKHISSFSSKLPIVVVETDEYGIPQADLKCIAHMGIVNNANKINTLGDAFADYSGRISIETRGQTSLYWPKKSYNIETQLDNGDNNNVSLLGMPAENDWILSGPFGDKTQIRNVFAYELGRKLGHWEPGTRFCELVLNGENQGLYVLTEKIKKDKNRVNIAGLTQTDIDGDDITGGYIVKYDKNGSGLQMVYPKNEDVLDVQKAYINNFFSTYYATLDSRNFLDPVIGYTSFINDNSLIDFIIINEVMRNCDAYLYSTFMYKDKNSNDKHIQFGPLWDFDFSLGNASWQSAGSTSGWQFAINKNLRITKVMRDTAFVQKLNNRWAELRKTALQTDSLKNMFDSIVNYVTDSRIRNYKIWPIANQSIANNDWTVSFDQAVASAKSFLDSRLSWIDANIAKIYYAPLYTNVDYNQSKVNEDVSAYPNPFFDRIYVRLPVSESGLYGFKLLDLSGKQIAQLPAQQLFGGEEYTIVWSNLESFKSGVYLVVIERDNVKYKQIKLIKS